MNAQALEEHLKNTAGSFLVEAKANEVLTIPPCTMMLTCVVEETHGLRWGALHSDKRILTSMVQCLKAWLEQEQSTGKSDTSEVEQWISYIEKEISG